MTVLSVMSAKGGTSKTTLSLNLFFYLKNKNKSVLFVDTDPQGSAFNFLEEVEEENKAFIENTQQLKELLEEFENQFDYIIFDTAPTLNQLNNDIMKISDKILITSKVSKLDVQSVYNTIDLVKNTSAKSYLLFVQTVNNSSTTKNNIQELNEVFKNEEVIIINNTMSQSVNYVNSINELKSIFNTKFSKQKIELSEIFSVFLN